MPNKLVPVGELPIDTIALIQIEVCEHTDNKTIVRLLPPYEGVALLLSELNSKLLVLVDE